MKVNKWNFITKKYTEVDLPDDKNITTFSPNLNDIVNCVSCFKPLTFGDSYTSRTYHTNMGFGYCICEDCYNQELASDPSLRG